MQQVGIVSKSSTLLNDGRVVDLPSFVEGFFKDPKNCSLESSRERKLPEGFQTMERGQ
jgi:hypothetical protein